MKYKEVLRQLIRACGFEITRCTPQEKALLRSNPSLRYRDLLIQETLTGSRSVGEIDLAEVKCLGGLVRDLEDDGHAVFRHKRGPIIEVGTLFGWSTLVIALHKSKDRELITVDDFSWNPFGLSPDIHFHLTKRILSEAINDFNVKLVRMSKDDFYSNYDGMAPTLVFFDAMHTYEATKADILWARSVDTGTICGHDYDRENCPGVVKAVDEFGGPKVLVKTLWVL